MVDFKFLNCTWSIFNWRASGPWFNFLLPRSPQVQDREEPGAAVYGRGRQRQVQGRGGGGISEKQTRLCRARNLPFFKTLKNQFAWILQVLAKLHIIYFFSQQKWRNCWKYLVVTLAHPGPILGPSYWSSTFPFASILQIIVSMQGPFFIHDPTLPFPFHSPVKWRVPRCKALV